MDSNKIALVFVGVALVLGIGIAYAYTQSENGGGIAPGTYSELAACISESGALFYGAYWCSHCNSQKSAFGDAAEALPYIECATPGSNEQTAQCREAEITSYPTWVFGNGQRLSGAVAPESLAEITGCAAPATS